jgi:predicted Zn-dependent protease
MARLLGLTSTLLICAWYALGVHQAQDINRASNIIEGSNQPTRAQARHALALLSTAATLNPDRTVDLLRAELALDEGHAATARRILAPVLREEPENVSAWALLARAAGNDRVVYYAALIHLRTLVANPRSKR